MDAIAVEMDSASSEWRAGWILEEVITPGMDTLGVLGAHEAISPFLLWRSVDMVGVPKEVTQGWPET